MLGVPRPLLMGSEPVARVWPGHLCLSRLQVSSYGGTLRYELHSETQRGDVFVPTESRPDVVLQVRELQLSHVVGWVWWAWPSGSVVQARANPHLPMCLPRATR